MRYIDNHFVGAIRTGKGVLVESCPLCACQLNRDIRSKERLIVSNFRDVSRCSCVVVVRERICDVAEDRHLRHDAILWCAARTALMKHTEAREVSIDVLHEACQYT